MPQFDYSEMDAAAREALKEFDELVEKHPEAMKDLITWLKEWYMKAGYKRLCRGIINS